MNSECLKLGQHYLLKTQFSSNSLPDKFKDGCKYAIKPNGGEIAILIENGKRNRIEIYSSVGEFITSAQISSGIVIELGWSSKEELLEIVYSDGRLQVLSDNNEDYTEVMILQEEDGDGEVIEAKFIDDESITVLTNENIFIKMYLFDMKKFKFARPACLDFNSPQSWSPTSDGSVIFALNSILYKLTPEDELIQKQIGQEAICHISLDHFNGIILVLTSNCRLLVLEIENFVLKLDIDVQKDVDIFGVTSITWLTNSNTPIAAISNISAGRIALVDLNEGIILQIQFPKDFHIKTESDGLRIFKDGQNWLVSLMPDIMKNLNFGKSEVSDFYDMFVRKDFDGIRALSSVKLAEIIDLGAREILNLSYEKILQENFINSIKFITKVLEEHLGNDENSRHTFSYITATVNRALVQFSVLAKLHKNGISLSPIEFEKNISIEQIIIRLCRNNLHGLSFEISVLLESDLSFILMDWAQKTIEKANNNDQELWIAISDKLLTWANQRESKIDYIQLAEVAVKKDRLKLAVRLLKLEKDTRKKIELLIRLNDYREAVIDAIQSKKPDQIKYVFDCLVKKLSLTEFFNLSNISEAVKNAVNSYCKSHERVLMQILLYQDDNLSELLEELMNSSQDNDLESLEKWFQLLRVQRCLERKFGIKLMGLTMSETLQEINQFGIKASRDFLNSDSFYSRSNGFSFDELKTTAASRADSFYSPSAGSGLRPSASGFGLNLPKQNESHSRYNSGQQENLNFNPSKFYFSNASPSPSQPQTNLKITAQIINGLIHKDKIHPDIGELLIGQFSREYIYGDEHRPILQFNKHSLIPEILLNRVRQAKNVETRENNCCFMGLFPEIRRAWLSAGNALYIWSFENNRDFTCYLKSQYEIIDVALVRPKKGIFTDDVEWIIVVITPTEIFLLAALFKSPEQSGLQGYSGSSSEKFKHQNNYSALDLELRETNLRYPSDEVNMISICGTENGRIFLAGSDGNIYELIYQSEADWFTSKCKKINRTSSSLSCIVPTFLRTSSSRACIVKLNHDSSRHIIYGLTEQSTIYIYWLGPNGQDFEFIGISGDWSADAMKLIPAGIISSSKSLEIVSIHPVDSAESDIISLVAICRSGIRLYFSIIYSIPSNLNVQNFGHPSASAAQQRLVKSPRGLRLAHLRAPPEENRVRDPKKLVHRWSPNIHCAFYSNGVTLAANTISNEEDLILGMIINPSVGSSSSTFRLPLEYSVEAPIDVKVWAIEELTSGEESSTSEIKGLGKEFALAHVSFRRYFAILSNMGVYIFSKLRPVDQLYLLLSERDLPWDQIEKFFDAYGADQACAFCIALSCRVASFDNRFDSTFPIGTESNLFFNSNVISVLLKFGGQPRVFESQNQIKNLPFSQNQSSNENYRDGIGRIIATQPEFENSAMHEGFYIFFARLVSTVWKRSLWDSNIISSHLLIDLNRFYKFMLDNLSILTEKRQARHNINVVNEESIQRNQNAIEFENESLKRLKETAGLLIELLTFLSICIDYKLLDAVRSEPIGIEHSGINLELLLTTNKGKTLITELGNILVQRQLRLHSPIRPLCESLRSRCASFFSEEDVFLQEGVEALERARICRSAVERAENVVESLNALKKACKVMPIANLFSILSQFDITGFPDSSIQLGLHFISVMDPENVALRREIDPNFQLNADEHEICRQREYIYERIMQSISNTGFDDKNATTFSAANPSVDIKALREKCLLLAASSRDELFHYRLYEWLVKSQYTQTLLELPQTEFLYRYLRSTFLGRDNLHRDLLWKWLARSLKYSEAAAVLAVIAESREYNLSLSERIEYLSLAITHCKSATLEKSKESSSNYGIDEISPIELSTLEELLEVAHTQYEVLREAKSVLSGRNDAVCAELDGLAGLLSVSELFNRYTRPYELTESSLRLIHISGLVNERLVTQLWLEIISKYVKQGSDRSAFHQLGSKITELARKFYPSPCAFPLAHLIDVLGRLALSSDIGADWLVAVLINSGIPLTALSDELHRFFITPPSKTWNNSSFRIYLLEMIVVLYNIWIKDIARVNPHNSNIISRLNSYVIVAQEINSSVLVDEFVTLLKQLANF